MAASLTHAEEWIMVAKAAWLTVEPEICLEAYLAGEEIEPFAPPLGWMPDEWTPVERDLERDGSREQRD
jgi:hypothetical protein